MPTYDSALRKEIRGHILMIWGFIQARRSQISFKSWKSHQIHHCKGDQQIRFLNSKLGAQATGSLSIWQVTFTDMKLCGQSRLNLSSWRPWASGRYIDKLSQRDKAATGHNILWFCQIFTANQKSTRVK